MPEVTINENHHVAAAAGAFVRGGGEDGVVLVDGFRYRKPVRNQPSAAFDQGLDSG